MMLPACVNIGLRLARLDVSERLAGRVLHDIGTGRSAEPSGEGGEAWRVKRGPTPR